MPLVSETVEAPYQGVSQAPPQVRLPTQADAIEDILLDFPDGASKRPPIDYVCQLMATGATTNLYYDIIDPNFLTGSRHFVMNTESGHIVPRVFNEDGTTITTTISSDAQTYLDGGIFGPLPQILNSVTVSDTTIITNVQTLVANDTATSDARPFEALIWVKASAYSRDYEVTVSPSGGSPVTANYLAPDGSTAASARYVDTDVIMSYLHNGGSAPPDNGTTTGQLSDLTSQGFNLEQVGSVLYLSHPTVNFTVTVSDGQGGLAMIAIKDKIAKVSDLPQKGRDGIVVRISQGTGDESDDFFLKFSGTTDAWTGIWEECVGPATNLGLSKKTMPVGFSQNPDTGHFEIDTLPWTGRTVGNATLSPDPFFIGNAIKDVSFWKGRLVLVAGESVQFSASDNPFRMYPATLTSVLDSDPIGLQSTFDKKSSLFWILPFERKLVLVGEKAVLQVTSGDNVLTPNTADIDVLTPTPSTTAGRPEAVNDKVYFQSVRGRGASIIYELAINAQIDQAKAEDMTLSVPRYIPASVNLVATCSDQYLRLYATAGGTQIYVHKFRYQTDPSSGQETRVQNAWSRWNIPAGMTLGAMKFQGSRLYLILKEGTKLHLMKMDIEPNRVDDDAASTILTLLDCRMSEAQIGGGNIVYDPTLDRTNITLPWVPTAATRVTVRAPGGEGGLRFLGDLPLAAEGQTCPVIGFGGNVVQVAGDFSSCPLYVGQAYSYRWDPGRIYLRDQNGKPIRSGRTQIRRIEYDLADTGYFRVEVTAKGRDTRAYIFEGYTFDDPSSSYNVAPTETRVFVVPVATENEKARLVHINDTHFATKLIGFTWIAELNEKSRRLS